MMSISVGDIALQNNKQLCYVCSIHFLYISYYISFLSLSLSHSLFLTFSFSISLSHFLFLNFSFSLSFSLFLQGIETIRYLEYCAYNLGYNDAVIHNYLLALYAQMQSDKLMTYLAMKGQDDST